MFERNRSKAVELLARFKDHATGAYYKGFGMLTLGWADSYMFLPLDFALLSSVNAGLRHESGNRQALLWVQTPEGSLTLASAVQPSTFVWLVSSKITGLRVTLPAAPSPLTPLPERNTSRQQNASSPQCRPGRRSGCGRCALFCRVHLI